MPVSNRKNGSIADDSIFVAVCSERGNAVGSADGEDRPKLTVGRASKSTEPYGGENKELSILAEGWDGEDLVSEFVSIQEECEGWREFYENSE